MGPEAKLEKILTAEVKKAGGWALKLPATFVAGLPDRLVLWPGGVAEFVEMKAPGKRPRKIQVAVHTKLKNLGFKVVTLDSKEGIHDFARRSTT